MIVTRRLRLATQGQNDVLNVTGSVEAEAISSGVRHGTVTVFVPGSTAGLTTVEFEPGVVKDVADAFRRLVPADGRYHHHITAGDNNGHSHVCAALLGPSLVVPLERGRLLLSTWA